MPPSEDEDFRAWCESVRAALGVSGQPSGTQEPVSSQHFWEAFAQQWATQGEHRILVDRGDFVQWYPNWPDWCFLGAVVYDENRCRFEVTWVGSEVELREVAPEGCLRKVVRILNPKQFCGWSHRPPKSRWDVIGDDD